MIRNSYARMWKECFHEEFQPFFAKEGPRGELDIYGILKALADVKFDGVLHIEYEKDMGDNLAQLAESMGYYRGIGDAVGRAAGTP